MDQNMEKIRRIIKKNDDIVLLSGSEVAWEAGLNGLRAEHMVYDIEAQYGYSGEEIVTSQIYSRQVDLFFDYYKNVILNREKPKDARVFDLAYQLERRKKLSCIITRMVYDFYQEAGCQNVVELYGTVEDNHCPACGKSFDSRYIKQAKGTPKCDKCQVILRPGFTMFGELIDNTRLTKAVNAIENADVLIVLGISLNSQAWQSMIRYYEGNKLILINTEEKIGDEHANYRLYGNIADLFEEILESELEEDVPEEEPVTKGKKDSSKEKTDSKEEKTSKEKSFIAEGQSSPAKGKSVSGKGKK